MFQGAGSSVLENTSHILLYIQGLGTTQLEKKNIDWEHIFWPFVFFCCWVMSDRGSSAPSAELVRQFLAGACTGVVTKTLTAPAERVKIVMQVAKASRDGVQRD